MIKPLSEIDKKLILDFCYQTEHENLFTIGSFEQNSDPIYFGYFEDNVLTGLLTFSRAFGIVFVRGDQRIMKTLIDHVIAKKYQIAYVPDYKKYAEIVLTHLSEKHDLKPKKIHDSVVMRLAKTNFQDFSKIPILQGTKDDIDDLLMVERFVGHEDLDQEITDKERERLTPELNFFLKIKGKIRSKANIHGVSNHYFQIGGVGTLPDDRRQGYAEQVISGVCKHFFDQGKNYGLLFTDRENKAARNLYQKIGFQVIDDFFLAEF